MRVLSFALACFILVGVTACAESGSIVTPDVTPDRQMSVNSRDLWGLYDVAVDPVSLEVTVLPARTAAFRMNVNTFMNNSPALLGISIVDGSNLSTTGELTLDVTLTHPVSTRPKLGGMDVHAVFLSNVSDFLEYDSDLSYPVATFSAVLLNADGWTRWYNYIEFTTPGVFGFTPGLKGNLPAPQATLSGYKLFADGLAATADAASWLSANQSTRAMFAAGGQNTRQFELQFAMVGGKPFVKFQYAIVASWAKPSNDDPGPDDYPPEANIQEAAHLRIDTSESTLYYTADESGGDLVVNVDIFDWQGGDNIRGEVERVIIESSVLNDPFTTSNPNLIQGPGDPYATFSQTIQADTVTSNDDVVVWVIVESDRPSDYKNIDGADYPVGKPLAAINTATAAVTDVVPPKPPEVLLGVLIYSGTTQCPDRSTDNNAILQVVAQGDLPLTYRWTISQFKVGLNIDGYDGVEGDGAGNLTVDFTSPAFASAHEALIADCEVSDGLYPPVYGKSLELYLDCMIFHADLDDETNPDNMSWWVFDDEGTTFWEMIGATDRGSSLTGTGALFQTPSGGVDSMSRGLFRSQPTPIPDFLSGARVEFDHSYSFTAGEMGANVRLTDAFGEPFVGGEPIPISSGKGYDTTISDSSNPLEPGAAFSAVNSPSPLYTSSINVPPSLLAVPVVMNFQAASGSGNLADGGWLIDDVRIIGEL